MKWFLSPALVGALLLCSPAFADDASIDAKARVYFADGTAHFQAGRYLEAQAAFAAGFELSHKAGFLWNMGECARLLGHRDRALELYRRYLVEAPNGPQRADVDHRLRTLDPKGESAPPAAAPPIGVPPPSPTAPNAVTSAPTTSPPPLAPRVEAAPSDATKVDPNDGGDKPLVKRWWFWTGTAAIVTGAVVAAVVASTAGGSSQPAAVKGPTIDWRSR